MQQIQDAMQGAWDVSRWTPPPDFLARFEFLAVKGPFLPRLPLYVLDLAHHPYAVAQNWHAADLAAMLDAYRRALLEMAA